MIKNILYGPKMGDFVQCLYISYHLFKKDGIKSNVILSGIGDNFENGLTKTFDEFKPIIEQQDFYNSFNLYSDQNLDINAALFRQSQFLFKSNWRDLLSKTFLNSEPPFPGGWLKFSEKETWEDTVIINRKPRIPLSTQSMEYYSNEIKKYKNAIFVGRPEHYYQFPLKESCSFYEPKDMNDWFSVISKGSKFIGSQSGPLSIAISLNKPILAELFPRYFGHDWIHMLGETKYHPNLEFTPF
jgi:hypothetical protein